MNRVIGDIGINSVQRIRVSTNSYKEQRFLDIRVFAIGDDGEWIPRIEGVIVPPDRIEELKKLLQEGSARLNEDE